MVQFGPDQRETLYVRRGGSWTEIGHGTRGRMTLFAGGRAILWVPSLGAPLLVVTPDGISRSASQVFPCAGSLTISPDGAWVDCGTCTSGGLLACEAIAIERRAADGTPAGGAKAAAAGCRFRRPGVSWYDTKCRAYALASCPDGSRALFRTDFTSPVERITSPLALDDAKSWYGPAGKVALSDSKAFGPLDGSSGPRAR